MIENIDFEIFKTINQISKIEFLSNFFLIVRNKLSWLPLYFGVLYLFWKTKSNHQKNIIYFIFISLALAGISDFLCAHILKPIIARSRPCFLYEGMSWYVSHQICSNTFSFPSCHATNHSALGIWWYLIFNDWKFKFIFIYWFLAIGFAQIGVGVHFPSDILGGYILGGGLGYLMYYLSTKYQIIRT